MRVAIIGAGNMSKRYSTILWHYKIPHEIFDIGNWKSSVRKNFDRYIVASSTEAHVENLKYLLEHGKKVLCEKPVCKDYATLKWLVYEYPAFQMLNQYRHLAGDGNGVSCYDYFKTGGDGLYWDCINIIGLAKGRATIKNTSPVWTCRINGKKLSIADMDRAYMTEISQFLAKPEPNTSYMLESHLKVIEGYYNA